MQKKIVVKKERNIRFSQKAGERGCKYVATATWGWGGEGKKSIF
ncbi:MAG: hypothetical protein AABY22_26020 [Nanoarchaeota archaeon]